MELLAALVVGEVRLLDYELLEDSVWLLLAMVLRMRRTTLNGKLETTTAYLSFSVVTLFT